MAQKNFLLIALYVLLETIVCNSRYAGFKKLGNYYITDEHGNSNEKLYYISSSFRANWINAKSFCSSYGMNLLALESDHEAKYFIKACENNSNSFEDVSYIGGTAEFIDGSEKWFLTSTGKEINYSLEFTNATDGEDNQCLALVKLDGKFMYKRINCNGDEKLAFICQKVIIKVENWVDIFGR